jgi:hypothetical protein
MHPGVCVGILTLLLVLSLSLSGCADHPGPAAAEPTNATSVSSKNAQPVNNPIIPPSSGTVTNPDNHDLHGIPAGSGSYVFRDTKGNADRPITLYTYRPLSWNTSGSVLFIMPGAGRTGQPSMNTWIPYGDRYSCLIIVPEFSQTEYPGDLWYPLGNMVTPSGKAWNPRANWTFFTIEHIFDDVRIKSGATHGTYLIFGHSAGAQFVQRFVTFLPEARFSRAVAANAGVYAMPDYSVDYPFGLKNSTMPEYAVGNVFSKKLIIMSGGSDTDPNDPGLANFPLAEAEGKNRFERAESYYKAAEQEARHLNVSLNWEYHVVPGVGHDESGMAGPSAEILFSGS